jgi:hypothetical protein
MLVLWCESSGDADLLDSSLHSWDPRLRRLPRGLTPAPEEQSCAERVHAAIGRDAVEPGAKRGASLEGLKPAQRGQ